MRLWDPADGEPLDVMSTGGETIWGMSFDRDGERLAATVDDGTVRIWDVATGKELQVLSGPPGERFFSALGYSIVPKFSPDGSLIASGGWGKLGTVWDVASGDVTAVLDGHVWRVADVDFSPDGTVVATTGPDGTVRLWDPASGESLTSFAGSTAEQYARSSTARTAAASRPEVGTGRPSYGMQ